MRSGILIINKPPNITSADVLNLIKRRFKIKKIGHGGTLDAFAEGILIAGIDEGTKLLPFFMDREKVYEAVFELGVKTDTLDGTGEIIYEYKGEAPEFAIIEEALKSFIGEIMQVPPLYSAVKIRGKRASNLVREGQEVELTPRKVLIEEISIEGYNYPELALKIRCGKGTYVRAIARDLGDLLGCGAYVKRLIRSEISPYNLANAIAMEKILGMDRLDEVIIPIIDSVPFMQRLLLNEEEKRLLRNGRSILIKDKNLVKDLTKDKVAMAIYGSEPVGIVEVMVTTKGIVGKPMRIFN